MVGTVAEEQGRAAQRRPDRRPVGFNVLPEVRCHVSQQPRQDFPRRQDEVDVPRAVGGLPASRQEQVFF